MNEQRRATRRRTSGADALALHNEYRRTRDPCLRDGWRELVRGNIEAYEISGDHINIIKQPHVGALATELRECIARSEKESKAA